MDRFSVVEDSFNIAWGFLERSDELRDAEASARFLVRFIEDQVRAREYRPLMIANRVIDAYRANAQLKTLVCGERSVWIA